MIPGVGSNFDEFFSTGIEFGLQGTLEESVSLGLFPLALSLSGRNSEKHQNLRNSGRIISIREESEKHRRKFSSGCISTREK
eukprot:1150609-Pelagomonas_calceolata.AAC.1